MATCYNPDGTTFEIPADAKTGYPSVDAMGKAVGGYICGLRCIDGRDAYVNDTGLIDGLPLSLQGMEITGYPGPLAGPVIVFTKAETKKNRAG